MIRTALIMAALLMLPATLRAQDEAVTPVADSTEPAGAQADRLERGVLRWEDLGVRIVGRETEIGLRIDITTLDDDAIALAADDIRTYFYDLKSRIPDTVFDSNWTEMTPFLVGYTGFEKQVTFDPSRLELISEGSTYYPVHIVPVSSRFNRRIVDLYETVYAIYLFDAGIDPIATLEFRYAGLSSGQSWRRVVEKIEQAKTRMGTARPVDGQ